MQRALTIDGIDVSTPEAGRLLPPRAFTSPAVYEAEMRRIFDRSWVHVGDLPELRAPGDFVTGTIGTTPVVVVRAHDGVLRGFVNACRHRGATIVEGRGNCGRQLRCPYDAGPCARSRFAPRRSASVSFSNSPASPIVGPTRDRWSRPGR